MPANNLRFFPLPLRSVTGVTLANPALWYPIGNPLERPCRIVKFDNLTDQDVTVSFNGVDAFTILPSGGFMLLDITSNKSNLVELVVEEQTQFYAQAASAPITGSVYVTAIATTSN